MRGIGSQGSRTGFPQHLQLRRHIGSAVVRGRRAPSSCATQVAQPFPKPDQATSSWAGRRTPTARSRQGQTGRAKSHGARRVRLARRRQGGQGERPPICAGHGRPCKGRVADARGHAGSATCRTCSPIPAGSVRCPRSGAWPRRWPGLPPNGTIPAARSRPDSCGRVRRCRLGQACGVRRDDADGSRQVRPKRRQTPARARSRWT